MEFLNKNNTALVLIDVQEKLFSFINKNTQLLENLKKIIKGVQALDIPIILTEQYPKGLGYTLPELKEILEIYNPIEKTTFSCYGEDEFRIKLASLNKNQLLVAGIESHICVYQTCKELDNNGYYVHLLSDCIGSRDPKNKELSITKLQNENNIFLTGYEMALFELLKSTRSGEFKAISKIVK